MWPINLSMSRSTQGLSTSALLAFEVGSLLAVGTVLCTVGVWQHPWPLLDASSTLTPCCDNQKCLQKWSNVPWWVNSLLVENHWFTPCYSKYVPRPTAWALPGNWLEMQNLRCYAHIYLNQHLYLNKSLEGFICTLVIWEAGVYATHLTLRTRILSLLECIRFTWRACSKWGCPNPSPDLGSQNLGAEGHVIWGDLAAAQVNLMFTKVWESFLQTSGSQSAS